MSKGKLIVLYGINNLGKTTQAKLLVQNLQKAGHKTIYIKYPVYDLEPSGGRINKYLRGGNPESFTPKQAQELYAENRAQYGPTLKADLENGFDIVAEDYWGTGVAWGIGAGVDKNFLLKLNNGFLREDLAILFIGKRFESGREENHQHETNKELTNKVYEIHKELAREFGWKIINANDSIEKVSQSIWKEVEKIL